MRADTGAGDAETNASCRESERTHAISSLCVAGYRKVASLFELTSANAEKSMRRYQRQGQLRDVLIVKDRHAEREGGDVLHVQLRALASPARRNIIQCRSLLFTIMY